MPTATSATAMETRAPTMIIEKTSRPKWSVPNQCVADGGWSFAAMSRAATSQGVQKKRDDGRQHEDPGQRAAEREPAHQRCRRSRGSTAA